MDLSKRGHLTPSEKTLVSQSLQIFVLDAIASSVHDMQGRLMFHGGTAISTVHGSPRWSEDLDFMINPGMSYELDAVHSHVEEVARKRISEITPGAKFDLIDKGKARGKVREADPGTVMRWTGRWEHPQRIGVVKMKTEFYIAEPEAAARYHTEMSLGNAVGLYSEFEIPTATLDTIWADKIMAMSARPAMKWRDVYDMGFIMENMEPMSDDHLFDRLKVACRSYRSSMPEIHKGLCRDYLENLGENLKTFKDDMDAWLPGMALDKAKEKNVLGRYHAICVEQIDRAKGIILERTNEIEEETAEEDYSCGF